MNYLSLENITKTYGEKVLFDNLSLQVTKGQKIALIAKNGSGKSTLLRVVGGMEGVEGENAKVWMNKSIRSAFLEQEPDFSVGHNLLEATLDSADPQLSAVRKYRLAMLHPNDEEALQIALQDLDALKAWDMEAKVQEILFRLNLTDFEKPVSLLSGGKRKEWPWPAFF